MRARENIQNWLDERFGWDELMAFVRHKTVPTHRFSYFYFLGGMTLFLFGIQVATGILLLLYYRPTPDGAFESVQYIMAKVPFGWLIRSIHSWGANVMILTAIAHMFSVFFLKSYRMPRELTWLSGMILLFLVLGFGFSGYLLPWNMLSLFATKVGTDMAAQVPVIGHWILVFLRGGDDVTGATLTRFFGIHVAILPGLATLFIGLHLLLVQRFGMSLPPNVEADWKAHPDKVRELRFFPNFLLRELMAWYIALAVLGCLAAFKPWELGTKADLFASAPAGIRPEWYFMFMFQTLRFLPAKIGPLPGDVIGVMGFGAAAAVWALLPFFDNDKSGRGKRWIAGLGIFALAYFVGMTAYAYLAR
ncbi:MAG TPA: cytochrome bc complex cytochrome b subunit [Candidatus Aquilonibacter sp.]|nr:cytochrome bc complex cytochrome b subunit [Candidatus Aquilonibacter sp.]